MERNNVQMGGDDALQPYQLSGDERAIQLGIEAARAEDREVDDATARAIAAQIHGGQGSALYSLASTGNLADERLEAELHELYQSPNPRILEWSSVLGTYALHREHKGPVDGWAALWPDPGDAPPVSPAAKTTEDDEAEARADLMRRINGAAVTTLGQVATIVTADGVYGLGADDREPDSFPWGDSARWHADGGPDELGDTGSAGIDSETLDRLFLQEPEAQLGSREEMGWCGLLRHEDRPGGVILSQNQYGRRSAWVTDSDEELTQRWQQLQEEHDAYHEATRSHRAEEAAGPFPEIWVGSLADYNAGHLHGVWLDATLEPDELTAAVQFMLRNSYEADAEEYGVFDYDGFGEAGSLLGEYPSLETVSRVAQGIQEHGLAFAAWAAYVGPEQHEELDRFEDHYRGEYESVQAYVEDVLDNIGFNEELEQALRTIPEDLRRYIDIDTEALARDWEIEMHIVEKPDAGVWVFDTNA